MEILPKFDFQKVRFDQENLVTLMLNLKAPTVKLETERQPLNLIAVLDISGSMSGSKIDSMKKTVQILVDHLTEKDRLGIVIFSTVVSKLASLEVCTSERKAELKKRISSLTPQDATNISGATLLGFELMKSVEGNINRLLLLTDGLPNVGVGDLPGLVDLVKNRPKGTTLTTFGFGTDHNPELLLSMAKAGEGNFYYIENIDSINVAFAQELGGLLTCYAQNISVKIEPKPGVEIDEVLNDNYEYDIKEKETEIRIPDMFAEETRNTLLKIKLEPRTSALPRSTCLASIKISFTNLVTKKTEIIETNAKIEFVKEGEESTERDKEVVEAETFLKAAKAQAEAVQMANNGNFVGAQALMVNCVDMMHNVGTARANLFAADLNSWSSGLCPASYNANVTHQGLRSSYSATTGRSAGQSDGLYAGTSQQQDMMRSFNSKSNKKSTLDTQKPIPLTEPKNIIKKDKKKKSNKPFTKQFLGQ